LISAAIFRRELTPAPGVVAANAAGMLALGFVAAYLDGVGAVLTLYGGSLPDCLSD
jgi:hypothetical protein